MTYPPGYIERTPRRRFQWLMRATLGRACGIVRGDVLPDGSIVWRWGGRSPALRRAKP